MSNGTGRCLPSVSRLRTVRKMEGIPQLLPASLDELTARHPDVSICHVGGVWLAWIPADGNNCTCAGEMVRGRDEAELLARLAAALGG